MLKRLLFNHPRNNLLLFNNTYLNPSKKSLFMFSNNISPLSNNNNDKKFFMLEYEYIENILEERTQFRKSHFEHAKSYRDNGSLVYGGAFNPPSLGAAIVFRCSNKEEVEEFARNDPYVINKLVINFKVKEWSIVIGCGSDSPNITL
eukprot:TRINITY_DN15762_c0_g1_i1.p1 TRINITY_DN15762_c0_g1~~TRINITY_DN15762_c0_g1_i1.p1  ORF type:complete len:147 (-),score=42.39 TRINITY_DN15762_c0_g1_i1:126-566(-)